MSTFISDNRLKGMLTKYLRSKKEHFQITKGLQFCGSSVIKKAGTLSDKTFLIANNVEAKLTSLARCHSPWSCPVCSPVVMAEKGEKIGAAIDALASSIYQQSACMITFTIPHTPFMSCQDSFKILLLAWRNFNKYNSKIKRTYKLKTNKVGQEGTTKEYAIDSHDAFYNFRNDLQVKHFVKAYEVTFGHNNAHPHIHSLWWVPNRLFDKIIDHEKALFKKWWKSARKATLQYLKEKYAKDPKYTDDPDKLTKILKRATDLTQKLYDKEWMQEPGEHKSLYISKDSRGRVRKISSAAYIAGWGGNMELTATENRKKARPGHYTPHQLLEEAYKCLYQINERKKFTPEENLKRYQKLMAIYLDYILATRGHRRVEFSNSGINKIIKWWQTQDKYMTLQKKKFTDAETKKGAWKIIHWFTEKQLQVIYLLSRKEEDLISMIIQYAEEFSIPIEKRRQLIIEYLQQYGIDTSQNQPIENLPKRQLEYSMPNFLKKIYLKEEVTSA